MSVAFCHKSLKNDTRKVESRNIFMKETRYKKYVKIIDITLPSSSPATHFPHPHHSPHCGGGILSDTSNKPPLLSFGPRPEKNRWMKLPPYSHCIFRVIERR